MNVPKLGWLRTYLRTAALALAAGCSAAAIAQSIALVGGTLIDGTGREPIKNGVIIIEAGRIKAVGSSAAVRVPADATVTNVTGKYIIPGMMDANVHLFLDVEPEVLIRYDGRYQDLILEAAQVELKNGLTTVFDTWGPSQDLVAVRDRINSGAVQGARIYTSGNIIGFDGPLSSDFFGDAAAVVGKDYSRQINERWTHNMGRNLLYMTPEEVDKRIADYIKTTRVDFVKYASSGHVNEQFIAFSPAAQQAIVTTVHGAGMRVAAHTTSVESLRLAVEAGIDIAVHCTATGPVAIPASTIAEMARRRTVCGLGLSTNRAETFSREHPRRPDSSEPRAGQQNLQNLIRGGVMLARATDSGLFASTAYTGTLAAMLNAPDAGTQLETAPLLWLQAARERGLAPMAALQAVTRNVAIAYGLDKDVGTLEPGKRADLVVLTADPLLDPDNYRAIAIVIKDGAVVDRDSLPVSKVLTGHDRASPKSEQSTASQKAGEP